MKSIKDFLKESLSEEQKTILRNIIDDPNIKSDSKYVRDAIDLLVDAQSHSNIIDILIDKGIYDVLKFDLKKLSSSLNSIYNKGTKDNPIYTKGCVESNDFLQNANRKNLLTYLEKDLKIEDAQNFIKIVFDKRIPGDKTSGNGECLLSIILSDAATQTTSGDVDVPLNEGKPGIEIKFANIKGGQNDFKLYDTLVDKNALKPIKDALYKVDEKGNTIKGCITGPFNSILSDYKTVDINSIEYKCFSLACEEIAKSINKYKKSGIVIFKGDKITDKYEVFIINENLNGKTFAEFLSNAGLNFRKFSFKGNIPDITFKVKTEK